MADSAHPSVLTDVQQPQSDASPRRKTTSLVQNFFSLQVPDAETNDTAIKDELEDKLVFDDSRVFVRLGLDRVSSQFVTHCTAAFKTDRQLIEARSQLQNAIFMETPTATIVADAPLEELAPKEEHVRTRKMYKPLATIFSHIRDFSDSSQSSASPKNSFITTHATMLKSDASTSNYSPDFVLFEGSHEKGTAIHWRNTLGFCEIRPTPQQSPQSAKSKVVKSLLCQVAAYARLHLSARPSHLFSVVLLIFGSQFCVAIFDRAGVLISPVHDMWKDTGIFVRVIRSLTCLSPTELGQDPTVSKLSDAQHRLYMSEINHLGRGAWADDFPTFAVVPGGRLWHTVGLPLWTSVSLLGRGTSIWLVQENVKGHIYGAISGSHPAVAKLHQGDDVLFLDDQRRITAYNLRGASTAAEVEGGDVYLHRLLLESRGRPLWEYTSEKELLQGMRAAVSGHKFLCDQGILHCDISAGNIMLSAEAPPEPGAEGFLIDLELAHIDRSLDTVTKTVVPRVHEPSGSMTSPAVQSRTTFGPEVLRRAAMTGTAQFMAVPILKAVIDGRLIKHEPHHNLESFLYVLAYTIARRAVLDSRNLDAEIRARLHQEFNANFGSMTFRKIRASRGSGEPLILVYDTFPALFSEPVVTLFQYLHGSLLRSADALRFTEHSTPIKLTHEKILSLLDKALAKMP